MRKILVAAALWAAFLSPALAANVNIDGLPAAASVGGTDLLECEQSGTNRKCTAAQTAAYVYGLMSADATANGTGALTLATVNANVGSFGSATNCVSFTTNAKGLIIAASQTTCTPAVGSITGLGTGVSAALAAALNSSTGLVGALTATNGNCIVGNGTAWTSTTCPGGTAANPTATAGPTAVNGVASTYMRSDGAPAVQQGSAAQKGIVQVDGTTITASSGVISTVNNGTVTSVAAGCGNTASPSPITGSGTISASVTSRTNTAATDTVISSDCGNIVYENRATAVAVGIANAGSAGFANGAFFQVCNINAGISTITPTSGLIGGAASYPLAAGTAANPSCIAFQSDGTNYNLITGTPGTPLLIARGTAALGTSAISSAACATVVTASATGVATTDVVSASFNGDPTAVTGYVPLTSGMLTIVGYPTANNVNFKVCNNTTASITPGAITLNWQVLR